jgi:transposase
MLYLAIDQHRKQLTVNLRNEKGDVLVRRQVSTQWQKVHEFFTDVARRSTGDGGFLAILEVCGFNDWLIKMLQQYDCQEIVLVHPQKRATKKTDFRDANALGELLWVNRKRIHEGGCGKPAIDVATRAGDELADSDPQQNPKDPAEAQSSAGLSHEGAQD